MSTTAAASGTFKIGGDLEVTRLGYGAMRIVGEGTWGEPRDRDEALRVLRRLPELGVDFVDTADSYGPFISEDLIAEALAPYDAGTIVATKGGFTRQGPGEWIPVGRPAYLRQCVQLSLRRLGVERIDLYQLHRIDSEEDQEAQFAELKKFQDEGLVRHLGLSQVNVEEIEAARRHFDVATVQNRFNLADRESEDVLDYCEREGIGFIPWFPLAAGKLAEPGGVAAEIAAAHDATTGQVALAWLLARSPVMLPIPGTSTVSHLEQNVAAADLRLSDEEVARLTAAG
ncbi:aldo/keto reductase [Conexibacter sp. JD483]|uniref:aldo/keto reductase n=1 Tax=unclassified Conexibacter TaxID=2627773 RepID=UPI002723D97B|nr:MULTISPECIES: aldo/keto reductase [unclassified Conexibacter]MDO8185029.1 aldo/keto reductase [Conexibacter sp. CPCC 205706]MDO8196739.1 aldo/keto reductase [Conexibacter sp. CPCC 205762]MDR9367987.1 aldo/keto reductase [Conexibacter sp. JD483]